MLLTLECQLTEILEVVDRLKVDSCIRVGLLALPATLLRLRNRVEYGWLRNQAWRRVVALSNAEKQRAWRERQKTIIADLQETIALQDEEIARLKAKVNRLLRRLRS